ncbi:HDL006Cp [Eremothecium sinecaudum]|uniref:HDL006Cp n=1 Tax=Eremothecium sinecaudum TaxID=45286 RepID=A0A0X8HSS6_9SACH|nr:HDL006Cp [Eremothecium sinecaudum]AMD20738.1 HDL006Cp [Eremothecium sinecaudum]
MSFLFSADSSSNRKKTKPSFESIKSSDAYRELTTLSTVQRAKELRQDNIFKIVSNEANQVKVDILDIHARLLAEIESEKLQADEINQKLKTSANKLDRIAKRVTRLRNKHDANTKHQLKEIARHITDISESLADFNVMITEIVGLLGNVDLSLPEKDRLINNQQLNEIHYPLLYDLFRGKFPSRFEKHETPCIYNGTDMSPQPIQQSETELHTANSVMKPTLNEPQIMQPLSSGMELGGNGLIDQSPNMTNDHFKDSFSGNVMSVGYRKDADLSSSEDPLANTFNKEPIPNKLLLPKFQRSAPPQTAATLENVHITEPFSATSGRTT